RQGRGHGQHEGRARRRGAPDGGAPPRPARSVERTGADGPAAVPVFLRPANLWNATAIRPILRPAALSAGLRGAAAISAALCGSAALRAIALRPTLSAALLWLRSAV